MAQLEDGNEKVTNSVIPNGTEAKVMRNLIENKGLLNGKGKLYAGTDDTTSTGAPVTTAIDPKNASEGSVLIKDSSQAGGWKVDKVGNNNIKSDDIYSVGGITSSGSIIIDPVTNDYNFRINNAVGGFTVYDDQGMAWLNADGSEGGFLNMPRTFTGGSSAGAGQTIATEEKVKEQLENGEIVAKTAQNATIAQYASTDTSKGTIEERLTSLGFKTGALEVLADDEGKLPGVALNLIRKEGNIVTIYYKGDRGRKKIGNKNNVLGQIPEAFAPQGEFSSLLMVDKADSSTSSYLFSSDDKWYITLSDSGSTPTLKISYNQTQLDQGFSLNFADMPSITVPEGETQVSVTQSYENTGIPDLQERPYYLTAYTNYISLTYDKAPSGYSTYNYNNVIIQENDKAYMAVTTPAIIQTGVYQAGLTASFNKETMEVTYTLSKYVGLANTPYKELTSAGTATASVSSKQPSNKKTLVIVCSDIFT